MTVSDVTIGSPQPKAQLRSADGDDRDDSERGRTTSRGDGLQAGAEARLERFSNFAISFTIISVLAGCFTTYGQAWNNGGPVAISWGWPMISIPILIVGSRWRRSSPKYPTAGGIYWWASDWADKSGAGSPGGSTGSASSASSPRSTTHPRSSSARCWPLRLDLGFINFADPARAARDVRALRACSWCCMCSSTSSTSPLVALFNNISVGWHVVGVAIIIGILIIVPDNHQSARLRLHRDDQQHRAFDGATNGFVFWFYVLPLGFLLTMYTQTGYDASAHISEETKGAAKSERPGEFGVRSSGPALIGWLVLLAITFAATDVRAVNDAAGSSLAIFDSSLDPWAAKMVILIATDRPALLRHGVPDQRLAHVLRVLARSRGSGPQALDSAQPPSRAGVLRHLHGDLRASSSRCRR